MPPHDVAISLKVSIPTPYRWIPPFILPVIGYFLAKYNRLINLCVSVQGEKRVLVIDFQKRFSDCFRELIPERILDTIVLSLALLDEKW